MTRLGQIFDYLAHHAVARRSIHKENQTSRDDWYYHFFLQNILLFKNDQLDQSTPGKTASHYSDQSMINLDFWPHE